jgi:hypothetical protein
MNKDIKVSEIFDWVIKELQLENLKYDHHCSKEFNYIFNYPLIESYDFFHERMSKKLPLLAFHIPDCTVDKEFEISKKCNIYSFSIIVNFLRKLNIYKEFEISIAFSLYSILHEIGHFYHLMNFSSKDEYLNFLNEFSNLSKQISTERKKSATHEENLQWEYKYRSMPGEKEANIYAEMNIGCMLTKYKIEHKEIFDE